MSRANRLNDKTGQPYLTQAEQAEQDRQARTKADRQAQALRILGLTSTPATQARQPPDLDTGPIAPEPKAQIDPQPAQPGPQRDAPPEAQPKAAGKPSAAPAPPEQAPEAEKGTESDYRPSLALPSMLLDPLEPGSISPSATDATTQLTGLESRLVARMVAGASWQEALDLEQIPPKARIRDAVPRPAIRAECERLLTEFASTCAVSRDWILRETLLLYRRAAQAEPVLDRKGRPTGTYRFDGATARGCLEMLGNQQGMFKGKGGQIAVSDVAQLLQAVAARGKPELPGDRARLVGSASIVAEQQSSQPAENPTKSVDAIPTAVA